MKAANKKSTLKIKKRINHESALGQRDWVASEYFPPFSESVLVDQVVFVMFCSFYGIEEVQESICDKCVAEKKNREGVEGLQMCRTGVRTPKRRLGSLGLKRKDNAKVMDDSGVQERRSRRLKRTTFRSKAANASWHIEGICFSLRNHSKYRTVNTIYMPRSIGSL